MNKIITASVLVASTFFTNETMAASMECYVDTQAHDQYTVGRCMAIVWGARRATAVFRVTGTDKPISSVMWGDKASSCGSSGTSCSFQIPGYSSHRATATILYQDGTWETTYARASFEDGR